MMNETIQVCVKLATKEKKKQLDVLIQQQKQYKIENKKQTMKYE